MNFQIYFNVFKTINLSLIISLLVTSGCDSKNVDKEQDISCKVYKPVCGSDDKTYSNLCGANDAGIEISHDGECSAPKNCSPDPVCGKLIDCPKDGPVCGIDGVSYVNEAAANSMGKDIAYKRPCFAESKIEKCTLVCQGPPSEKESICADDGFRYPSECWAAIFGKKKSTDSNCRDGLFSCAKPEEGLCLDGTVCKNTGLACAAYEPVVEPDATLEE